MFLTVQTWNNVVNIQWCHLCSVGYDTFVMYHDTDTDSWYTYKKISWYWYKCKVSLILDTLLIFLMNTKCRFEKTQTVCKKHELVYEIHSNSNTVPFSSQDYEIFKLSMHKALEIAVSSWKIKSFVWFLAINISWYLYHWYSPTLHLW